MKNEEWAAHRIAAIEILHSSLFTLHSSLCNLLAVHYIYAAWQRIDGCGVNSLSAQGVYASVFCGWRVNCYSVDGSDNLALQSVAGIVSAIGEFHVGGLLTADPVV